MDKLKEIIQYAEDITLLYVEDDEDARHELSGLLGIFFKKIIVAKNGKEGMECFKNSDIDLVISDITMPVMNGLEMMHHLKSQGKEFKAIFITASSGKDILLDSIELNIDGYILKPISQVQLITVLSKIINIIHSEKVKQNFDAQLQIELKKQKATIEKQSNTLDFLQNSFYGHLKSTIKIYQSTYQIKS